MKLVEKIFVYGSLAIITLTVLLSAWWLLCPYNPVIFDTPTMEVLNCPCTPGTEIVYSLSGTVNGKYHIEVSKSIINGHVTTYEPVHEIWDEGSFNFKSTVQLTESAEVGTSRIRVSLDIIVNPLRHVYVTVYSDPFQVIDAEAFGDCAE